MYKYVIEQNSNIKRCQKVQKATEKNALRPFSGS